MAMGEREQTTNYSSKIYINWKGQERGKKGEATSFPKTSREEENG